jgi:tape measure domain-containing protein
MASIVETITLKIREDGSRQVARNIEHIGDAADGAENSLMSLQGVLAGLITGATLLSLARMADEFTNLQNRLRLVTTDSMNLARITKELGRIANDTRSDFTATAELYARMATSSKELGLSQQELLNFTKSLNQAVILSGASAEEAAGGIRQLSQGMASGTLRGDELNSVLENLPAVADIIAKGLGITRGELRQMGQEGELTATAIIDAFKQAEEELNQNFGTAVPTLGQSLTVLKNNFLLFIGELDQSYGITRSLSELILDLANNMDTLVPILAGVGVALSAALSVAAVQKFAVEIQKLWAIMLANPFVAVAAVVLGLVTTLYLLRDEIKLGIDDTTTLGDLMRAAWEDVGPAIEAVADLAAQFFGWLTNTSAGTFDELLNDIVGYEHQNESTWFKILRVVVQVFDMIGGTIRGVMAGVNAVVMGFISAWINSFAQLGNAIEGVKELDADKIKDALTSNLDGYKKAATSAGDAFSSAFQAEILSQADSGLEALLDDWTKRAKEIGDARAAAANAESPLAGATKGTSSPVDEDALKKAAKELARLKSALDNVRDAADPVGAATRRMAEAQDILNRSVKAGLITQKEATKVYEDLAFQMRDQLDPLAALNREIDDNIRLLKMSAQERRIESQMLQLTQQLRRDGVTLTKEETDALRAKLVVEEELDRISRARDSIQSNSAGQQLKDFADQVKAMQELLAMGRDGGGLNSGDVANELQNMMPWANLEGTQEQMAAYIQAHADMYAQIKLLEDEAVINHQTAEMLRAQADVQYMEQRLNYQRQFFGTLAGLSRSSNRELAAIGKAAAITQATIDGVLAVQKTMAETPYPYNIPLAIAQGALAAANVAQIASQSVGFRTGGEMTVGGSGGVDSQLVSFRATPGEKVRVNTPAQDKAIRDGGTSAPPQVNQKIVNVVDKSLLGDYLSTAEGQELVLNIIDSNPERIQALVNN